MAESWTKCSLCGAYFVKASPPEPRKVEQTRPQHKASLKWPFTELPPPVVPRFNQKGHYIIDSHCYDLEEMNAHPLLQGINQWDYPTFELNSQLGETILSKMTYCVFTKTGLFEAFRIPMSEFLFYFRALEGGYRDKPCK